MAEDTMMSKIVEAESARPIAWVCLTCRTVVVPGAALDTPAHECVLGGEMEPLLPLRMVVDLLKASREATNG